MTKLPEPVLQFLARHHVMSLATQGSEGPWAAAVFYVHDDQGLVFLSSPGTRHCHNLALDARCAATIQQDYEDWPQIQGVQLEGRVQELSGDDQTQARQRYAQTYPIAGLAASVPAPIAKALAKVHWYRLRPDRLYLIDNTRGFGQRSEFVLTAR
jgi:uncharacterized protein